MDPVAIELSGEIWPVVHDERDIAVLGDRLKDPRGAPDRVVVDVLQTQLQTGHIAAGERLFKFLGKSLRVERGRRDQIKPCRRPRVVSRQRVSLSPDRS